MFILCGDGGGYRGIIPARIMSRLDREAPGWRDGVGLYFGTSTWALLALGLAHGLTPADMVEVYRSKGPLIFGTSTWRKMRTLWGLVSAKYAIDGLEATLREIFGETRLRHLRPVGVTAFDLSGMTPHGEKWKPKVFHNVLSSDTADLDVYAYKAGLYSAAAPVYFPDVDGFIDGGIWGGNPVVSAIAQACDARNAIPARPDELQVLSFGTGRMPYGMTGSNRSRGLLHWWTDIVGASLAASGDAAEFEATQLLGDRHFRAQWTLPTAWAMDDFRAEADELAFADSVDLRPLIAWRERF